MPKRNQVAALPVRKRADGTKEILLITARGKTRWLIPKGSRSRNLTDEKAAAREALEEGGHRQDQASAHRGLPAPADERWKGAAHHRVQAQGETSPRKLDGTG